MDDLISRQALCEYALNQKDKSVTPNDIMRFPSAQPEERTEERTETHACDLISRQQAIDAVNAATVITNPEHFKGHEKFTGFMEDEDISSFGKWERANGFNTALVETRILLGKLPSAQPDLDEWCPDCKEYDSKRHCCPRFNRVIREALKEVQSERKTGRWIDNGLGLPRCSQCGGKAYGYHFADCIKSDFCPHCGADMRGEWR